MKIIFSILLTIFIATAVIGGWLYYSFQPVSSVSNNTSFVIRENESGTQILSRLQSSGLIRSALVGRLYLRLTGGSTAFRPGAYVLTPNQPFMTQLQILSTGPQDIWVTFPEGWRREQYAGRLTSVLSGPASKFNPSEFLTLTSPLEGQLFPDTYLIPLDATSSDIVRILTANFTSKTQLTLPKDQDLLILASLIERESKSPAERPVIAGILKNRLDSGWFLGVDATVQYAVDSETLPDKYWQPISNTKYSSKYNTYSILGLPPTPICNPGLNSIQAALNPASTPYFYYLHAPDGTVHFAKTLAEHNSNIDKYLSP